MSQAACKYRIDPAPIFLFTYIAGSVLCAAFVVMLAAFDPAFRHAKLPAVLETIGYVLVFFGPPYAALCALVLTHYFRYEVTADAVRGQTWIGRTVTMRWSDVAAARPVRVGNLDFVRLTAANNVRVWLPMFVHPASPAEVNTQVWGMAPQAADAVRTQILTRSGASIPTRAV